MEDRNRSPSNVEKGKLKVDAPKLMLACRRSTGSLLEDISSITPHIPVMSEELKTVPLATREHYQYMWYIEPMDGLQAALSTGEMRVSKLGDVECWILESPWERY